MTTEQMDWIDDNGKNNEQSPPEEDFTVEAKDAFAPENFHEVSLIMQMRLYDLNLALLSAISPEKAAAVADMHERGQSFAPPPAFIEYSMEDSDDSQE